MKKTTTVFVLLGAFFWRTPVGFGALPDNFRDEFPKIVQKLCHPSYSENYSLDLKYSEVKTFYHKRINEIFNNVFMKSVQEINKLVSKENGSDLSNLSNELKGYVVNFNLSERIEDIQSGQEGNEFKSTCDQKRNKEFYSPCRVTETAFNEFCAYQLYLWAKIKDEKSFFQRETNRKNNQALEYIAESSTYITEIEQEMKKSKQALLQTLFLYQQFEQNYRMHVQLVALKMRLQKITLKLTKFLSSVKTFPDKFIDASKPK